MVARPVACDTRDVAGPVLLEREREPAYDDHERRLAEAPVISVPTITLEGDANGAPIRTQAPLPASSQAPHRTGPSRAASATTSPKKPPEAFANVIIEADPS
jgi:hypothetical protein